MGCTINQDRVIKLVVELVKNYDIQLILANQTESDKKRMYKSVPRFFLDLKMTD